MHDIKKSAHLDAPLCPLLPDPLLPGAPEQEPAPTLHPPLRVRPGLRSTLSRVPHLKAAPLPPMGQEAPPGDPNREEVDAWYVIEVVA